VAKLKPQNDSVLAAAIKADPVLTKHILAAEAEMVIALDALSVAEKKGDSKEIPVLATKLGAITAHVAELRIAQADLHQLRALSATISASLAKANPTGEVCNGGQCAPIPPLVAVATILTAGLVGELNKPQPFGPNNDIMKALHAAGNFIQCIFGCK
jgi:hypothetical protein